MRQQYKHWMITEDVMAQTHNGYFMHCLPVRRNVVVADEVLDSPRSIVVHQAANRLHIQKTLLSLLW
jgi:ornithine carbamoyltransferase